MALQWRHNERHGVLNRRCLDCLLNRLFRRTSKLRVTGLCEGNPLVTGGFPLQRASEAENASLGDVIMFSQYIHRKWVTRRLHEHFVYKDLSTLRAHMGQFRIDKVGEDWYFYLIYLPNLGSYNFRDAVASQTTGNSNYSTVCLGSHVRNHQSLRPWFPSQSVSNAQTEYLTWRHHITLENPSKIRLKLRNLLHAQF